MTLLLAIVFGKIFHTEIKEYAPYILTGMIVWEFVTVTAMGGSLAFVQADAYIKQCRHPLAIYTLRTTLTNLFILLLASTALIGWVLVVMPQNFGWTWLAAVAIYPIVALIAWPMATLLAYIGARFRDIPHALGLVFQAMWFVSPIYFQASVFRDAHLDALVDLNPIYHLLEIIRAPLLHGAWPREEDFAYCFALIFMLAAVSWLVGRRAEDKVIFYL